MRGTSDLRLTRETLPELVDVLHANLPGVSMRVLLESLRPQLGGLLRSEMLRQTAWRLAGNLPRLKAGKPVPPWRGQSETEWVPAEVVATTAWRLRSGALRHRLTCEIQAGLSVGLRTVLSWSTSQARYFAVRRDDDGRGFMFSRPPNPNREDTGVRRLLHAYHDSRQFVGLRCRLLIGPTAVEEPPHCEDFGFGAEESSWNATVQRHRTRGVPKYACRLGMPDGQACYLCPVGTDRCPWAVHPLTYETRDCGRCGTAAPFDPAGSGRCCVNCETAFAVSRKKDAK